MEIQGYVIQDGKWWVGCGILEDFGSGIVFSNDEFLDTTMGVGG